MSQSSSAPTPTEHTVPAKTRRGPGGKSLPASDDIFVAGAPPCRLTPQFLSAIRSNPFPRSELATLAGFTHACNLSTQLHHPFTLTEVVLTRFQRLAAIINFDGPLFVDTPMPELPEELAATFTALRPEIARALVVALPHLTLVDACRVTNNAIDRAINEGKMADLQVLQAIVKGVQEASEKAEKAETP